MILLDPRVEVSRVIPNLPARLWRDSASRLDSCLSAKGRSASGGRRNDNHDAEHRGIKPEVALIGCIL